MLRSGTARTATPDDARGQQSLGDLVGLALKDVSQLVRYEINLAKSEFKVDVRRALVGTGFIGFILIVAYPMIIMLLFAYAYGLRAAGLPGGMWGAFLVVAGTVAVFALIALIAGIVFFKKITGMKLTRTTVSRDIGMLKRGVSGDNQDVPAVTKGNTPADGARADGAPAAATARSLAR